MHASSMMDIWYGLGKESSVSSFLIFTVIYTREINNNKKGIVMEKRIHQVNKHGRLIIEKKEDDIKSQVLKMLKEDFDYKNENEFNNFLVTSYNAYDDEMEINKIFGMVSDIVTYDYISGEFNSYGQVSYWSKTIRKTVMLTQDDNFCYDTLDAIIEAIKSYETEVSQVEYNMKHNKGAE